MLVFWERGYEGVSMSDLTAAMEINSPSLYAAFGSKEALFREAVERYGERFEVRCAGGETAREAVEEWLLERSRTFADQAHPPGCMVVLSGLNCTARNTPIREFLAQKRRAHLDALRVRLAQGVADGDIPENTDLDAMVRFFGTVLHGLAIQALDGAREVDLRTVVDAAMAAWPRFTQEKGAAAP